MPEENTQISLSGDEIRRRVNSDRKADRHFSKEEMAVAGKTIRQARKERKERLGKTSASDLAYMTQKAAEQGFQLGKWDPAQLKSMDKISIDLVRPHKKPKASKKPKAQDLRNMDAESILEALGPKAQEVFAAMMAQANTADEA